MTTTSDSFDVVARLFALVTRHKEVRNGNSDETIMGETIIILIRNSETISEYSKSLLHSVSI